MNKFFLGFISSLTLLVLVGCANLLDNNQGVFGKASKQNASVDSKIKSIESDQASKNDERLTHIGSIAQGGVQYSLDKITNAPKEVIVAKEMNERVEALANKPDFNEVQAMRGIVDDLLSEVQSVRDEGKKNLLEKDGEITGLQNQITDLNYQKEQAVNQALQQADANALKADQYAATLGDMDKYGGLGAIIYGVKELVVRMAWILGIGGFLFILLRILSFSNPLAASIFSIFSQVGSWIINAIEYIIPKSASAAGLVAEDLYTDAQTALNEIITGIQTAEASGKPISGTAVIASVASSLTPTQQAQIQSGSLTPASSAVLNKILTTPTSTTVISSPVILPVSHSLSIPTQTITIPVIITPIGAFTSSIVVPMSTITGSFSTGSV